MKNEVVSIKNQASSIKHQGKGRVDYLELEACGLLLVAFSDSYYCL